MLHQISASAGSGKTYTLTQLFLGLLHGATQPEPLAGCTRAHPHRAYSLSEILAATFTNKAAVEMKTRILGALKTRALHEKSTQQQTGLPAAVWVQIILRHYNTLNIHTIDSLLTSIVRLSVLELGLPPDFTPGFTADEYLGPHYDTLMQDLHVSMSDSSEQFYVADKATLTNCLNQACDHLIRLAAASGSSHRGFTHKEKLRATLYELVDRLLTQQPVPIPDSNHLYALLNKSLTDYATSCQTLLRTLKKEQLQGHKKFVEFLEKSISQTTSAPPESAYSTKPTLDDCLLKQSQGKASAQAQHDFADCMHAYAHAAATSAILTNALQVAPLTLLAHELYARMKQAQPTTPIVPQCAIPVLAKQALDGDFGVSDTLCKLGTRLTHILLDEFQDTSQDQWHALLPLIQECLAHGGSFTYVGDTKQAIYGWRGGDAALFDAVLAEPELTAIVPKPTQQTLPYNWRSHPHIVQHNNIFFSQLAKTETAKAALSAMLPADTPRAYIDSAAQQLQHIYSSASQETPQDKHYPENKQPSVCLYEIEQETTNEVEQCVERRLHRLLHTDLLHRVPLQDIALLVRTSSEGATVANWLSGWGIPVITENSFLLETHPLICRLIAFLQFIDYPPNDLAFWEVITDACCFGSVTGLHSTQLTDWLSSQTVDAKRRPLYQRFQDQYPHEWNVWIAPFLNQAGLLSAYDTLQELIKRFALHTRFPDQAPFLRRLLEIAYLAEKEHGASIAAFLAFWAKASSHEKLPLPEGMNAIRIMTMHKAKGLEFPVVILPFHHGGKSSRSDITSTIYQDIPLLVRVKKNIPDAYYASCISEALEQLNLLYVAWTRPTTELHAFITRSARTMGTTPLVRGLAYLVDNYRKTAPNWLYTYEYIGSETQSTAATDETVSPHEETAALTPSFSFTDGVLPEYESLTSQSAAALTMYQPMQSLESSFLPGARSIVDTLRPTDNWRPMAWLPQLRIFRSPLHSKELTPERRGTLAHLCLEHLTLSPLSITGNKAAKLASIRQDVMRAVNQALRLFPLPLAAPEEAAASMHECLFWFASQPFAHNWLAHGMREQAMMAATGDIFRVDLLVPESDGSFRAIDYKTGHPSPSYHIQVQRYMDLLHQATGKTVTGTLVYLDEQTTVEVLP